MTWWSYLVEILLCDNAVSIDALFKYRASANSISWTPQLFVIISQTKLFFINKLPFCLWHCVIMTENRPRQNE